MIKLLIADDEPLVCVGLQSMLKWGDFGVQIVGTARNGQQAAQMIEQLAPDIVISDIKMPLKSGLELLQECTQRYGRIPLFIMLTSYEEFEFLRKAMRYQALDYLIKLELNAASLSAAITKGIAVLEEIRSAQTPAAALQRSGGIQALREKFFIRLFNNLFDSEEQYRLQKKDLNINFSAHSYAVAACEIQLYPNMRLDGEKLLALCISTVQMARDTLGRYLPCYVTTLDMRHFTVTFCLPPLSADDWQSTVAAALKKTTDALRSYFNVDIWASVGQRVENPRRLSVSYHSARKGLHGLSAQSPLVFFSADQSGRGTEDAAALSTARKAIRRAFEEMDTVALYDSLTTAADEISSHPDQQVQALDTASNILYMAISLLPDGEKTVAEIFCTEPDGYRSVYSLNTAPEIAGWVQRLRDGCCERLQARRQGYKRQVVENVKAYINENLSKKLSLNEVAAVFNFSPNYLSQLFAKSSGEGFVEYITSARVAAAKEMLARGDGKIYEIAKKLGFESSFYFSKVFKKVEGISPSQYLQRFHPANIGIHGGLKEVKKND